MHDQLTITRRLRPAAAFRPDSSRSEGCLVCGGELAYNQNGSLEKCLVCGKSMSAQVKCRKGHYICDACHVGNILQNVESMLAASTETDPVILAQRIFELPRLNMHGPEYHSIVPAVLVTAHQNLSGTRSTEDIQEAIRRGKSVQGGSCGLHGNCGAGVGSGIAVSIIEKATPMTGQPRSLANRATATALLAISAHVGPRCCKRDAITSIKSFMQTTTYFSGVTETGYTCSQFSRNRSCIGQNCPYFITSEVKSDE